MSTPYKEAFITGTMHMLYSIATINNNVVIDLPVFTEYTSPVSIEHLNATLSSSKSARGGGSGGQEKECNEGIGQDSQQKDTKMDIFYYN